MGASNQLEHEVKLHEGTPLLIRPVQLEDEKPLRDMFAHCSAIDVHFRCCGAIKDFDEHMAHRLTHLDTETETALVATNAPQHHPPEAIFGIAHIVMVPNDPKTAEFDVMVRSDFKGHGLGYELMTEILQLARRRGHCFVTGFILRENRTMLQMALELGFQVEVAEGDMAQVRIALSDASFN
jgi:acetyltransferase